MGSNIGVENFTSPSNVHGIIANPVCTEFSIARSGGKARNPEKGMELVRECQRIIEQANPVWWVIENPATGALRTILGQPTITYEPWHYGSPWTKRTALWGNFTPPPRVYERWDDVPKLTLPTYQGRRKPSLAKMHYQHVRLIPEFADFSPKNDMEFRSLCSQKFAQAFYKANP